MKPMTEAIRSKIMSYKKNGLDISELIEGVSIRGLDLSYAKILKFDRVNEDISRCNFTYAEIGQPNTITNLCGSNFKDSCFYKTKFLGVTWFIKSNAISCNFNDCDLSNVNYSYCDFTNSTFIGAIIKIGSKEGKNATFSNTFIDDLVRNWNIKK